MSWHVKPLGVANTGFSNCDRLWYLESQRAAENRLREIETAKAEGRYVRKNKNVEVNLIELREWYFDLEEVIQERSYHDIGLCINNFINRIGNIPMSQLTPELIEKFRKLRLTEISKTKNVQLSLQPSIVILLISVPCSTKQ